MENQMSRDDYIGVSSPAEEEEWEAKEQQQAQEEAHKHFVIQEFSAYSNIRWSSLNAGTDV